MVRVIERQDRGKNCPAAIFTPRQPDVSLGQSREVMFLQTKVAATVPFTLTVRKQEAIMKELLQAVCANYLFGWGVWGVGCLRSDFWDATLLLWRQGFSYGAGAETLIFVTGTSGKYPKLFVSRQKKPKSAVDTQKTKKNSCLGIRCWDPNLSGGYQNCGLGIHPLRNFPESFWEKLWIFLESLGGSQRQLCIKTRPLIYVI